MWGAMAYEAPLLPMKHPYGACTPPVVRAAVAGYIAIGGRRAGDIVTREHTIAVILVAGYVS